MPKVTLEGWECLRCNHQWLPRETELPKVCPKCKSPYWNTPRLDATKRKAILKHFKNKGETNG